MSDLRAVAALLPMAAVASQCPNLTLNVTTYGQPCGAIFASPAVLQVNVNPNPTNCSLAGLVAGAPGPGPWTRIGTIVALGTQPTNTPIDILGVWCDVYTIPTVLLFEPDPFGQPAIFVLPVPPNLPPFTFQAQGGVLYSSTTGDVTIMLSAGNTLSLQ